MKILKSWLKDYIDIKENDEVLSDLLTFSGTLVDSLKKGLDDKIIVAKIKSIKNHPNADRLHLVTVDTGKNDLEIVCGAPNITEGQIVPLAQLGTKLGDFEIKEAIIRGVKSTGMLCSEKELGISENHEGIMILPENYKIGESLNKYLSSDTLFDLEITPNRGDCLSHLGVARELKAVLNKELKFKPEQISTLNDKLKIEIKDPKLCFQYYGAIIENVKIAPSPEWLKKRLEAVGLNSINNVVDITNYIMMDLGQPLHAFDRNKVFNDTIIVRTATDDEVIATLDGQNVNLNSEILVIANKKVPMAIAGVMGGLDSEISDNTTEIILESAEFERRSIRKTAKTTNHMTEASYRYERGIDPEIVKVALAKAAKMICEICGGKVTSIAHQSGNSYQNDWIEIEHEKINNLLGTSLSLDEMKNIFQKLDFEIKNNVCKAPTWRHDIEIWQDLAEEIGRIYGFKNIKLAPIPEEKRARTSDYYYKEYIKDILVSLGFTEIFSYPFLSASDLKEAQIEARDLIEVANPLQSENKYMRNSLIPGLLKTVAKNPTFDPILIFELGNIFTKDTETSYLGAATSGKNSKKIIEEVASKLVEVSGVSKESISISERSRDELNRFKIRKPVTYTLEIPVAILVENLKKEKLNIELNISTKKVHYRAISKYPSIVRDLAFIVDKEILASDLTDLIYKQSNLINRVELFDEFASDKFGKNKKNVAYHINMQHQDRTLTDKEADEIIEKIVKATKEQFRAEFRTY